MRSVIRYLTPSEVHRAHKIAKEAYFRYEAPSKENLTNLHKVAYDLFLGFFEDDILVAFVCGSRYYGRHITSESFETHLPNGETVVMHCICTHRSRRRRGIALALLRTFIHHVEERNTDVRRILLLCHACDIPLFTRAGFIFFDRTDMHLGSRSWYEMEYTFFKDCDSSTFSSLSDDSDNDTITQSEISTWTSVSSSVQSNFT